MIVQFLCQIIYTLLWLFNSYILKKLNFIGANPLTALTVAVYTFYSRFSDLSVGLVGSNHIHKNGDDKRWNERDSLIGWAGHACYKQFHNRLNHINMRLAAPFLTCNANAETETRRPRPRMLAKPSVIIAILTWPWVCSFCNQPLLSSSIRFFKTVFAYKSPFSQLSNTYRIDYVGRSVHVGSEVQDAMLVFLCYF